jgi:hypothetical protein
MKKLKQRVTLKRRRRNKMRHSHKMQRGGGIMDKARIAYENRKYEKMTASDILKLPDTTLPEYLIIIADKNLKDKIERNVKTILERTQNSWQPTNFKNWAKGDMELDNKIMEYFTAYNKIAQILTQKLVTLLQGMEDNDPRIDSIKTQLFEFFCKYITVIGKVLNSTTKQLNKNILLKMLYKHRVAGTLKNAITDTGITIPEIGGITLSAGIQEYNIDTDKIKIGDPEQLITVLTSAIDKNNRNIAVFKTGITNAKSIITEIDQVNCSDSDLVAPVVNSVAPVVAPVVNSVVNSGASGVAPVVAPGGSGALPLVNDSHVSASGTVYGNVGHTVRGIVPNSSAASAADSNDILTANYLTSINNEYSIVTMKDKNKERGKIFNWLKKLYPLDHDLTKKSGEILKNIIDSNLSPKDEAELAAGLRAIEEGRNLSSGGGGKRNRKRKQRGGGKDEILNSLTKFVTDASQQIEAQAQAGVVDNPMDNQTTSSTAEITPINPRIISTNPQNLETGVPIFATPLIQEQQQQPANYGTMEQIIAQHEAANEKQTAKLLEHFERLAKLIEGRIQGSRRETGEMGTGTETERSNNVLDRSVDSNEESEEESKDLSVKLGDLNKLTGDTYVQTVKYLKLLKAIIKKQPDKEGFDGVVTAINTAIELLQKLIADDNSIIKIDSETRKNLEADNADIVEILFSLLGIGVTTATLGGKRKRKCKRNTIKRMKYRRDKKGRKTKKRPRRMH